MSTQRTCCLLQRLPAGRRTLGSELAGIAPAALWTCRHAGCLPSRLCSLLLSSTAAETPATELLRSSVSHARQLTFAPRTPVCPSAGGIREGGKCRVPAPMTVEPTATPHLICRCVTSWSLYVRITFFGQCPCVSSQRVTLLTRTTLYVGGL